MPANCRWDLIRRLKFNAQGKEQEGGGVKGAGKGVLRTFSDLVHERVDRDISVGIATRYGLDGPGLESRWGRHFPHSFRPALVLTQLPIEWVPGLFRGVKRPGRGVDHPHHLAPMLRKE